MAEAGFEPAISKLWTWRDDLLLHSAISIWRFLLDLNQWITDLQSTALPTWLRNHNWGVCGWEGYNPSIYSLLDTTLLMLHWLRLLATVELLFLLERNDTQHICLSQAMVCFSYFPFFISHIYYIKIFLKNQVRFLFFVIIFNYIRVYTTISMNS